MLPSQSDEGRESSIPVNMRSLYADFKLISETSYYTNYSVKGIQEGQIYIARVLNSGSPIVEANYDIAAKFFVREALHLCMTLGPGSIVLESFEIDNRKIGFIMEGDCMPLMSIEDRSSLDIERLIKDLSSEINDLNDRMGLSEININPKSTYFSKKRSKFFIGDWFSGLTETKTGRKTGIKILDTINKKPPCTYKCPESVIQDPPISQTSVIHDPSVSETSNYKVPKSSDLYFLGLTALEMCDLKVAAEIPQLPQNLYNLTLEALSSKLKQSDHVKQMIEVLLAQEPVERLGIQKYLNSGRNPRDLLKKEFNSALRDDEHKPFRTYSNEIKSTTEEVKFSKELSKSAANPSIFSKKNDISTSDLKISCCAPDLKIACCTRIANTIRVQGLQATNGRDYNGPKIKDLSKTVFLSSFVDGWGLIEQAPKRNKLITSHCNLNEGCLYTIDFESAKLQKAAIYKPNTGFLQDISMNHTRDWMACLSIKDEYAYHIYDCSTDQLVKTGAWQKEHKSFLKERVSSLDLHPEAQRIVLMDTSGSVLASSVDDDKFLFSFKMPGGVSKPSLANPSKCRWSPTSSVIAMHHLDKLNFLDPGASTKQTILPKGKAFKDIGTISSMCWESQGKLLALCGAGNNVVVYDYNSHQVAKVLKGHQSSINSVRWSPCGNYILTASTDHTAKVFDYNTGEKIGEINAGAELSSACFLRP